MADGKVVAIDTGALPWEARFNETLGKTLYRKNLVTDPETGMEEPTGMTIPLAVSAQWTAIGPQSTSKSHSKYTQEGMFSIDRAFMTSRGAQVEITISGPDWTFEVVGDGQIMDLRAGTITHFWPDVMSP